LTTTFPSHFQQGLSDIGSVLGKGVGYLSDQMRPEVNPAAGYTPEATPAVSTSVDMPLIKNIEFSNTSTDHNFQIEPPDCSAPNDNTNTTNLNLQSF
jgi:hypothetical protein